MRPSCAFTGTKVGRSLCTIFAARDFFVFDVSFVVVYVLFIAPILFAGLFFVLSVCFVRCT